MKKEEKQKLNFIEFDHNDLHFECFKGGMVVYKDGEKIGQCFDVFTKFMPPKEDIIKLRLMNGTNKKSMIFMI